MHDACVPPFSHHSLKLAACRRSMRLMVLPSVRSPLAPSSCCSSSPLHPDRALWAGDWGDSACSSGAVGQWGSGAVGQGNVGRHGGGEKGK